MEMSLDAIEKRIPNWFAGAMMGMVGLVFCLLGITLFPVIGLLVGIGFLAAGAYMARISTRVQTVEIIVGPSADLPTAYLNRAKGTIPVAILSTSRARGDRFDFDATTIDPSSVRFGPRLAYPIEGVADERFTSNHLDDINEDGNPDYVFYFPVEQSGITMETDVACVTAETLEGETIRGCTHLRLAA